MSNDPRKVSAKGFRIPPWIQNLLKITLGAAAIWGLIHSGALNPSAIGHAIARHPGLCLTAFAAYWGLVLISAWLRWFVLVRSVGLPVTALMCFKLHMIGIFFNSLIPGGTGGDLIKGYYIYRDHEDEHKALALTSIAMDRLIGLYGLLCVAMVMTWVNYDLWRDSASLRLNSIFYLCVFLGFSAAIVFFFSPWSDAFLKHPRLATLPGGGILKSLSDSLMVYRQRPKCLLLALALGGLVDFGLILLYYLFALSLGLHLPLIVHGFVVPTLTMINGIPISPSGLGVGEAAGEVIYRSLGVMEGGSEVMALVHMCIMLASLTGAPFYFLYRSKGKAKVG